MILPDSNVKINYLQVCQIKTQTVFNKCSNQFLNQISASARSQFDTFQFYTTLLLWGLDIDNKLLLHSFSIFSAQFIWQTSRLALPSGKGYATPSPYKQKPTQLAAACLVYCIALLILQIWPTPSDGTYAPLVILHGMPCG